MTRYLLLFWACFFMPFICWAQTQDDGQNLLFDDSDIIITAEEEPTEKPTLAKADKKSADQALNSARELLNQKPAKLQQKIFPQRSKDFSKNKLSRDNSREAPFGLVWGDSINSTKNQGVYLTPVEMKDYINSYSATHLSKQIDFFDRIFVVYGKEDELYRILAYSKLIDDDASASKGLQAYQTYSSLLEKKYGNKEENFTPAVLTKIIKNSQGKDETITENAPIGNPNFLDQLQEGTAVLYSTFHDKDVASALSIGVDGDKKSYIVIDYRNLKIIQKQENKTLDAL